MNIPNHDNDDNGTNLMLLVCILMGLALIVILLDFISKLK